MKEWRACARALWDAAAMLTVSIGMLPFASQMGNAVVEAVMGGSTA